MLLADLFPTIIDYIGDGVTNAIADRPSRHPTDIAPSMLEALVTWLLTVPAMPPIPNPNYSGAMDDPELGSWL